MRHFCSVRVDERCEILYVSFALVSAVLSFYLFLRSQFFIQAFGLHMICVNPFTAFSLSIMCFCLSCVKSLLLSLGTETSHFERSCACLFTWLLDLLNELLVPSFYFNLSIL